MITEGRARLQLLLALIVAMVVAIPVATKGDPVEFPGVYELLEEAGFSPEDSRRVFAGEVVWREKVADSTERELTVQLAFLLRKTTREVTKDDIFGFSDLAVTPKARQWSKVGSPVGPEDFAPLAITEAREALTRLYLDAEPGDALNLSDEELASFRRLRSKGPVEWEIVRQSLRQLLIARLQAYRDNGLSGIAPYRRKKALFDPARDLRSAVEAGVMMKKYAPQMHRTLLEYPSFKAPGLEESFAWIHFTFEDLPCLALTHQMALEIGDGAFVVANRHFYATRSYNVSQEQGGLFPVDEGSLFLYSNRASIDALSGMGSSIRHQIGRKMMSRELVGVVERMRTREGTND